MSEESLKSEFVQWVSWFGANHSIGPNGRQALVWAKKHWGGKP